MRQLAFQAEAAKAPDQTVPSSGFLLPLALGRVKPAVSSASKTSNHVGCARGLAPLPSRAPKALRLLPYQCPGAAPSTEGSSRAAAKAA